MKSGSNSSESTERAARAHERAWYVLVAVLAIHVVDEALTDFLSFYNPLVLAIRERIPYFPMPTFSFAPWLAGLAVAVLTLALLGPAVRRGRMGTTVLSWIFSGIMLANGLGHLLGSIYFQRWLPGATSAPLLLAGSVLLAKRTMARKAK
jgi:hypothetical protein